METMPDGRVAVITWTPRAWEVYDLARCLKIASEKTRAEAYAAARNQGYQPMPTNT